MRTALANAHLQAEPCSTIEVVVEVFNTRDLIDGVTAEVVGLGSFAECRPLELALFPETSGTLTLLAMVPAGFPSGAHDLDVIVRSTVPGGEASHERLRLDVLPCRRVTAALEPSSVSGRSEGRFQVVLTNDGNIGQSVSLMAIDPQGALQFDFERPLVDLAAGASADVGLGVAVPRRMVGGEVLYPFRVEVDDVDPAMDGAADAAAPTAAEVRGTFAQKPILSAGLVTALVLAAIVGLWAAAVLFAVSAVMARDPYTKNVPASFYASSEVAQDGGAASAGSGGSGGSAGSAPAGAVPKSGPAPAMGGSITGKVVAASTGAGVGRVTVEVVHVRSNGEAQVFGAGATEADGTYQIGGLLPGPYRVHFGGNGFEDRWFPAAASVSSAADVRVAATSETAGTDVTIVGDDATLIGTVDTGVSATDPIAPPTVVAALSRVDDPTATPLAAPVDATGVFTFPKLTAPADYNLTLAADGYRPSTVPVRVNAGQQVVLDGLRLDAGKGTIRGTVTDGGAPLGGVLIQAESGTVQSQTATPTVGTVGQFLLPDLPTPGTYLLTFTLEGYGTQSEVVFLGPGASRSDVAISLSAGSGMISGTVRASDSRSGIGGAAVTVTGGASSVATTTLSSGADVGTYLITGLDDPGTYTVTVAAPGFRTTTIAVDLSGDPATGQDVVMAPSVGTIAGTVRDGAGHPLPGATVTATDGLHVYATTSVSTTTASSPLGSYTLGGLPAGRYTVTFSLPGYRQRSYIVTVSGGGTATPSAVLTQADA